MTSQGIVFECKRWPYSGHCGQAGYEPLTNPATPDAWRDAWKAVGHCTGTISPTTSPNVNPIKSVGACPGDWVGGIHTLYDAGDKVAVTVSSVPLRRVVFRCKAAPLNGYCAQYCPTCAGGYLGWDFIGSCDPLRTKSPTTKPTVSPTPSPTPDTLTLSRRD